MVFCTLSLHSQRNLFIFPSMTRGSSFRLSSSSFLSLSPRVESPKFLVFREEKEKENPTRNEFVYKLF